MYINKKKNENINPINVELVQRACILLETTSCRWRN